MRRVVLPAVLLAGLLALSAPPPVEGSASWSVSVSYFHETLAPYGRWVVARGYGEVWVPAGISAGWEPYWEGEWIWTDYGWTWVSYDPWGDVPYHYGTWVWVDPYGWVWEPGTVWAPAWVTWAWTDDFIGWAPVPPTFGITVSGYTGPAVVAAPARYVFVPANQFVGVRVQTVRVPVNQNPDILTRARKATRFTVSGGVVRATADPPLSFVQRVSGKRIERASLDKLKARPSTLAAARVSGKHIRVVAPASERTAAASRTNRKEDKVRPNKVKPSKEARVAPSRNKRSPSREAQASKPRPSSSVRVATAPAPPKGSKIRSHERIVKKESAKTGPKSKKVIVRESHSRPISPPNAERHAAVRARAEKARPPSNGARVRGSQSEPATVRADEEKRVASNSRHARPEFAPSRERPREPAPRPAPPPQVKERPHPAPAPPAQVAHHQAPKQPREKEREKSRD